MVLGILGGLAGGKSTVAGLLAARGAAVIDADRIGHEVLERAECPRRALVRRSATGCSTSDGPMFERRRLAERRLRRPSALEMLNGIVHPADTGGDPRARRGDQAAAPGAADRAGRRAPGGDGPATRTLRRAALRGHAERCAGSAPTAAGGRKRLRGRAVSGSLHKRGRAQLPARGEEKAGRLRRHQQRFSGGTGQSVAASCGIRPPSGASIGYQYSPLRRTESSRGGSSPRRQT